MWFGGAKNPPGIQKKQILTMARVVAIVRETELEFVGAPKNYIQRSPSNRVCDERTVL